jgi:hypothetical protein
MSSTDGRSDEALLRDLVQLAEKKVPETLKNESLIASIRVIIQELESVRSHRLLFEVLTSFFLGLVWSRLFL